jgi:urease accessory protein
MAAPRTSESALQSGTPGRTRLSANLSLSFERDADSGATQLRASSQEPPLRVVRGFARQDGSSLVHLHNVSGGLLGGDRLSLALSLAQGAEAQITTTGATRIYRPAPDAAPAEQINRAYVGESALLEYIPDAIIPYCGVRFLQRSEIHLAQGAGLFWWEILAPGREARGETFAYEHLQIHTDIVACGQLIAAERMRLQPASRPVHQVARLADLKYVITLYICRVGDDARRWLSLEDELREAARDSAAAGEMLWGISTLPAHGVAVRGLARRGHGILTALQHLWRIAKLSLYSRGPILPRKVN